MSASRCTMLPLVALALGLFVIAPIAVLAQPRPTQAPPHDESTCVPEANQIGYPKVVLVGETTDITLAARALCPSVPFPLHIVLVLDGSPATSGRTRRYERDLALGVIDALRLPDFPQISVGAVVFGGPDTISCGLTNDGSRLRRCIDQVLDAPAETGDVDDLGLDEAMAVLVAGRRPWIDPSSRNTRDVILLLTDARCVANCRDPRHTARKVRSEGVLVLAACVSGQCDRACVRSLASSQRYFFDWPTTPERILWGYFRLRDEVININIKRLTLTGTLADGTRYVPESAVPPPDTVSLDGRTFTWVTNYVPRDGITVTLRVQLEAPGDHPVGLAATGLLLDNQNRTKDFTFPQPWAVALGQKR
jgi:hypothetical protein